MKLLILQTGNKSWKTVQPLFEQAALKFTINLTIGHLRDITVDTHTEVLVMSIGELPLEQFDAIYLRCIGSYLEEASLVAEYARQRQILLFDWVYKNGQDFDRKSFECVRLSSFGISYPKTFIGSRKQLLSKSETIGFPLIIKTTHGRKSEKVYKVNSLTNLKKLITNYNQEDRLLIQQYIDNDYYLRLTVVGGEVIGAMKRNKSMGSGLGVSSEAYEPSKSQKDLAIAGAKAMCLDVAGVDMMVDREGNNYILEVNRSPQYRVFMKQTGINVPEKILSYFKRRFEEENS